MAVVQFRVTDEMRQEWHAAAAEEGVSPSEWARAVFEKALRVRRLRRKMYEQAAERNGVKDIQYPVLQPVVQPPAERGVGWTD